MPALKINVMLDNRTPSRWIVDTLELLHQQDHIQLHNIIVHDSQTHDTLPGRATKSLPHKLGRKLLFGYINRPRFKSNVLAPTTLTGHLSRLIKPGAESSNPSDNKAPSDILLQFSDACFEDADFADDKPEILNNMDLTPNLGTWSVKHAQLSQHIEHCALKQHPILWVHLWNTPAQQKQAVCIASHSLPTQTFSIDDLIQSGFGCLPMFIVSRLNWAAQGLHPEQVESSQVAEPVRATQTIESDYDAPPLSGMAYLVRAIAVLVAQTKKRIKDKTHMEQWQLGFSKNNGHASNCAVNDFTSLPQPANTIWADPHTIVVNNQTHVFFEELEITENKGRIASAVLTPTGFEQTPVTVLDEPHHLSYPSVFEYENNYYMIPETASKNAVSLYKSTRFPHQWEHLRDLISNVDFADSTLFFHNGLWWMFTNGVSHEAVDERDTLLIFYCKDFLIDTWQAHPLNPVVTGVDRARMAGHVYEKDGVLFRPTQYGAQRYGYGLNVAQIHTLNTEHYEETLISRTIPTGLDKWVGCHTASHGEEFIVVDRLTYVKKGSQV